MSSDSRALSAAAGLAVALTLTACAHRLELAGTVEQPGLAGVPITLGHADPSAAPTTRVQWSFGDGSQAEGQVVSHAFGRAGSYLVRQTITDGEGVRTGQVSIAVERRGPLMAVPVEAGVAVVLEHFFNRLDRDLAFLSRLIPAERVQEALGRARDLLGFDPLKPESLLTAGIDPDKGLAWVTFPEEPHAAYLLIGTFDDQKAKATLDKQLANAGFTAAPGPAGWTRFRHPAEPELLYKQDRGYLIIRQGAAEGDPALALSHFDRVPDSGMLSDPVMASLRAELAGDDIQVFATRGYLSASTPAQLPTALRALADGVQGLGVGVTLGAEGLEADLRVSLSEPARTAAGLLFAGGGAPALPSRAPQGASFYAAISGDVESMLALLLDYPRPQGTLRSELPRAAGAGVDPTILLGQVSRYMAVAGYFEPAEYYRDLIDSGVPVPRGDLLVDLGARDPAAARAAVESAVAASGSPVGHQSLPDGTAKLDFTLGGHPAGALQLPGALILGYGSRQLHRMESALPPQQALRPTLQAVLPAQALEPGRAVFMLDIQRIYDVLQEPMMVPGASPGDLFKAHLFTEIAVGPFAALRDCTAVVAPSADGLAGTVRIRLRQPSPGVGARQPWRMTTPALPGVSAVRCGATAPGSGTPRSPGWQGSTR